MDPAQIITRLKAAGIKHELIAEALGRSRTVAVQIMHERRPLKAHEIAPLEKLLEEHDAGEATDRQRYVPVEVLPAYPGMGGGGMIADESERETALVPRDLIEHQFRGKAHDFLIVHPRGDSMKPKFYQGDQVLVDRRDRDPIQPGPFALRVGDTYVLKNVERTRDAMRVFSANSEYSDEAVLPEEIDIIGRPVWVGRML